MQPKNNVYSGIFFLLSGKLTIAMIVFKVYSETGKLLVIYYVVIRIKMMCLRLVSIEYMGDVFSLVIPPTGRRCLYKNWVRSNIRNHSCQLNNVIQSDVCYVHYCKENSRMAPKFLLVWCHIVKCKQREHTARTIQVQREDYRKAAEYAQYVKDIYQNYLHKDD